jgi:hypothetical protein
MSTQVPPSRLDSTKDFSSLVPSAFAKANAAYAQANTGGGAGGAGNGFSSGRCNGAEGRVGIFYGARPPHPDPRL